MTDAQNNKLTAYADAFSISLGAIADPKSDQPIAFTPSDDLLATHAAFFGGTRKGKSKLFEHICRQLIMQGQGFAFVDPHGDTADDLMSFLAFHFEDLASTKNNIHYLNPNPGGQLFSYDPFLYCPPSEELGLDPDLIYFGWLHNKCELVTRAILRGQTDTEEERQKMPRLARWLFNVLYAVGIRQDGKGTHQPFSDARVLLQPNHRRFSDVFDRVSTPLCHPLANEQVLEDLLQLRRAPMSLRDNWTESSLNALSRFLTPITTAILDSRQPTIDFRDIIRTNGIIIANFQETTHGLSRKQSVSLSDLLITEINNAVRTVSRSDRNRFYLFIDEAHNFLDEDFEHLLTEAAKFKLSCCLAVQHPEKLKKGSLDLLPGVLSQCGIRVTFQQQRYEDAELLAKSFCWRQISYKPLMQEVDRDGGVSWELVPTFSKSEGTSQSQTITHGASIADTTGRSVAHSQSNTDTVGHTKKHDFGIQRATAIADAIGIGRTEAKTLGGSEQKSHTKAKRETVGRSKTTGETQTDTTTDGESLSETHGSGLGETHQTNRQDAADPYADTSVVISTSATDSDALQRSFSRTSGTSKSAQQADSFSKSSDVSNGISESTTWNGSIANDRNSNHSVTVNNGSSTTLGTADSVSHAVQKGITLGYNESHTLTQSESHALTNAQNQSQSVSISWTPVRIVNKELQYQGQLHESLEVQVAKFTGSIMNLEVQHCLVSLSAINVAFHLRIDDVLDPYHEACLSDNIRTRELEGLKQLLYKKHLYFIGLTPPDNRSDSPKPAVSASPLESPNSSKQLQDLCSKLQIETDPNAYRPADSPF